MRVPGFTFIVVLLVLACCGRKSPEKQEAKLPWCVATYDHDGEITEPRPGAKMSLDDCRVNKKECEAAVEDPKWAHLCKPVNELLKGQTYVWCLDSRTGQLEDRECFETEVVCRRTQRELGRRSDELGTAGNPIDKVVRECFKLGE